MNLLKSIFISTFPLIVLIISVKSGQELITNGFSWQYAGALLASLPIVLFFVLVFTLNIARTSANLMPYTLISGLGMLLSAIGISNGDYLGISLAAIAIALWGVYLFWYSKFENRKANTTLKVGQPLPNFQLEDANGNKITSDRFRGNLSIYLFYRGNWCPLCMAQIKEIAREYKELEKRGVNMVLISPQPSKNTASLARKYQVGFQFLVDKGNQVAQQLKILAKNGLPFGFQALGYDSDTDLPTVVITDKNGKILFVDLTDNYRVRPEPSTFLKVLDGITA